MVRGCGGGGGRWSPWRPAGTDGGVIAARARRPAGW